MLRHSVSVFAEAHATRAIVDQIANKWSVMILAVVCAQPERFTAIKRRLVHTALTEALRRLERNRLLEGRLVAASPMAIEYPITPLGRSLQAPIQRHGPDKALRSDH